MARRSKDAAREPRIHRDSIAEAAGPEEHATSWYTARAATLQVPVPATCTARRAVSPLEPGEECDVVGIAPEEECPHAMFVLLRWRPHELAVPLHQGDGIQVEEDTQQALEDWHYWVERGYPR